ncbi:MAG: HAD-IA family hydrolase [Clostridia bacterium]|nr:HAD-IA family hydrolase [Clostridia bacterium]
MSFKSIVFDLDGTIADTIPLTIYSLREVTRELTGKVLTDEDILKEFGPIDTEIIKKLVDNDKREISAEAYIDSFSKNFDGFVKPIEGIIELLQYIKSRNIKVGLFTGRSIRVARIILKNLNVYQYFDEILAGDDTTNPKPDPEGIIKTLEKLEVKSSDSIYVGDFDVDILASRAAGTTAVLALWSSTGSVELVKLNPDKYFKSPYEFIDWLKASGT